MSKDNMLFVGIDLGDKFSHATELNQKGELVEEARLPTARAAIERKFSLLPKSRIAMEVGTHSRWASQLLEKQGHEVLVANARKLRAIYTNPRKGDKADAAPFGHASRKRWPAWPGSIRSSSPPSTTAPPKPRPI